MKNPLFVSTFAVLAAVAMSGAASAEDWKGYAGAFCHGPNNSVDVRRSATGIVNWSAQPTRVYCPIAREIAEGGPNALKEVAISLFNNHATVGGSCTLVSRPQTDSGVVDSDQVSWPAGYAAHTIRLGPVDANNFGNYLVYCQLPGTDAGGARKSVIYNVRADESGSPTAQ